MQNAAKKEHGSRCAVPKELHSLSTRLSKRANATMRRGSCRVALECSYSAEALSHLHGLALKSIGPAKVQRQLQA